MQPTSQKPSPHYKEIVQHAKHQLSSLLAQKKKLQGQGVTNLNYMDYKIHFQELTVKLLERHSKTLQLNLQDQYNQMVKNHNHG